MVWVSADLYRVVIVFCQELRHFPGMHFDVMFSVVGPPLGSHSRCVFCYFGVFSQHELCTYFCLIFYVFLMELGIVFDVLFDTLSCSRTRAVKPS